MAIGEDGWLTAVLGYPVYSLSAETPPEQLREHAQRTQRALYFAKVATAEVAAARALTEAGMYVVDAAVTLSREPGSRTPAAATACRVAPLEPAWSADVLDVAGSCFRRSRFHLDPEIPDELAHRVKREWIRSYVEGARGVELLVALQDDTPVGFLAVLEQELDGRRMRVIDLVGVAPQAQGRGVGVALVTRFVERHEAAADELRVGTQIANTPSLKLYARLGFAVSHSSYVLHQHVRS